jgi:hypothetical protein
MLVTSVSHFVALRREKEGLTVALPRRLDKALWASMPDPECTRGPCRAR